MVSRVFWPKHGIEAGGAGLQRAVGWSLQDVVVVVGLVDEWMTAEALAKLDLGIVADVVPLGAGEVAPDSTLRIEVQQGLPVRCHRPASIVLFDPPDPSRLRYLTTGSPKPSPSHTPLAAQDGYGIGRRSVPGVTGMVDIVSLLNATRAAQRRLRRLACGRKDDPNASASYLPLKQLQAITSGFLWLLTMTLDCVGAIAAIHMPWTNAHVKDYSASIRQLDLRASQLVDGPRAFRATLYDPTVPLYLRSQRYVKFWNTIWLILNDMVLGYCSRELVKSATPVIAGHISGLFQRLAVRDIVSALTWLNDWPVGLKLNTPLSQFFWIFFSHIVTSWGACIVPLLSTHGATLLYVLSLSGHLGFTLSLSILRDALSLSTLHLHLCHAISFRLLRWQTDSLGGLWNLFRGKKWNVLRQRTDSYAYDVDQLFLGTLLFTVSAFLFPTVAAYAALFAGIRGLLWLVDALLNVTTRALNAFPLFEVLLRLKEPSRLPAGIVFRLRKRPSFAEEGLGLVLELRNAPRSLGSILLGSRSTT